MLLLKPDVKKWRIIFLLFVLLDLLHTASHPLFDLGLNV